MPDLPPSLGFAGRRTRGHGKRQPGSARLRSSRPDTSRRRRADSNRCARLCRPLPNPSATSPGNHIVSPASVLLLSAPHVLIHEKLDQAHEILREQVLLAIPMKPLCKPECKGLCPRCGVNLNLKDCGCAKEQFNPNLDALLEIKRRLEDRSS